MPSFSSGLVFSSFILRFAWWLPLRFLVRQFHLQWTPLLKHIFEKQAATKETTKKGETIYVLCNARLLLDSRNVAQNM
jgi:hypothetical protein